MRVEILTELWNPWNTSIMTMPKMPQKHQNRFLEIAISLRKASAIDPANHVLYRAVRRPPKNRCFWPPGPENHGFQPVSALCLLNRSFRPISAEKRVWLSSWKASDSRSGYSLCPSNLHHHQYIIFSTVKYETSRVQCIRRNFGQL